MARIVMKVKVAKQYDIAKMTKEINRVLNEESRAMQTEFKKTTKTWSRPPKFQKKKIFVFNGRGIRVFTTDKKMLWLNRGTKTRWAVMSSDFTPKTRTRVIGSRSGSGRAILKGRRIMTARGMGAKPGIKAREFDKEIAKRRKPKFAKNVKTAIKRGIKR